MDTGLIGGLIRRLRTEHGLTQRQLAQQLHVSDKAVSKWERGLGCPDVSLLPALAQVLGVELEGLLSGQLDSNEPLGGTMKKLKFYVCPVCGNLVTALAEPTLSCCGKKLTPLQPQKAEEDHALSMEPVDGELFLTTRHPMEKGHSISFVALLTGDGMILKKLYPEWDLQVRLPAASHGKLLWYCTRHGLFYQNI